MAKPSEVRSLLRRYKMPYDVLKIGSTWYVFGDDTWSWQETCLYLATFANLEAEQCIDMIRDMIATKGAKQ